MEKRRLHILEHALTRFSQSGIESTTIADVAKAAEVGEATIYRYFTTKQELVLEVGALLWQRTSAYFSQRLECREHQCKSGIEQIAGIINLYLEAVHEKVDLLRFIYSFDAYVLKQHLGPSTLPQYHKNMATLEQCFRSALEQGARDGTVRVGYSASDAYLVTTTIVGAMAQKLLGYQNFYPPLDQGMAHRQIALTCELLINSFRA